MSGGTIKRVEVRTEEVWQVVSVGEQKDFESQRLKQERIKSLQGTEGKCMSTTRSVDSDRTV